MTVRILGPVLIAACLVAFAAPALAGPPRDRMTVCTYPVADLVLPIQGFQVPSCPAEARQKDPATLEDRLVRLLVGTVEPATWQANGGRGAVEYFPLTMSLVVSQTPAVQERVAHLLAALRREQDVQVALEVRIVTVSEDFLERVGVSMDAQPARSGDAEPRQKASGPQPLDDRQAASLLEAVQGDQRANVMQAPKLMMFNGQVGTVHTDGFRMTARPIVSADRRYVQVSLNVELNDPGATGNQPAPQAKTMTIENTVSVPDGGTVLLGGLKRLTETRTETSPPVLGKVPYVNRLFRNVGYGRESQSVLVMVTPRVIIASEEEAVPARDKPEKAAAQTTSRQDKVVADLLKAYQAACTEGRSAEARKYARAALAIDPTCFRK
jgi:type II secretory pathway component GspD/PulD (secretin)